eukprot:2908910-Pyramimonas_sp.AAC.1
MWRLRSPLEALGMFGPVGSEANKLVQTEIDGPREEGGDHIPRGKFRKGRAQHTGPQERAPMSIRHTLKRKREEAEVSIKGASSDFKEMVEEARKKRLVEQKTRYRIGGGDEGMQIILSIRGFEYSRGAEDYC